MLIWDSIGVAEDDKDTAKIFQEQFSLVLSDPSSADIRVPGYEVPEVTQEMSEEELMITEEDMLKAISDTKSDSAAGPDELPALFLKKLCWNDIETYSTPLPAVIQAWSGSSVLSKVSYLSMHYTKMGRELKQWITGLYPWLHMLSKHIRGYSRRLLLITLGEIIFWAQSSMDSDQAEALSLNY